MTDLSSWTTARPPERAVLQGRHVRLEPLDPDAHASQLWEASQGDPVLWKYLPDGPFEKELELRALLEQRRHSEDPLFFAIVDERSGAAQGVASYLRIEPEMGVIEIGHIWFGAALQRTRGATEAIYLLAREAFEGLGNRRLEWKCNAENERSRRAAHRFGFRFEGVFRQHMVIKGQNRDTAWYAMLDRDWPRAKAAFEAWLADENFDAEGAQLRGLAALR